MDSHSPRYGSPYANSEVFIFIYSWFIPFSHYTVSEHKRFPNIATKAGYPGTGMEQKETGLENSTIPKKKDHSRNQRLVILASLLALRITCGSMTNDAFFIQLPCISLPMQCNCSAWFHTFSCGPWGFWALLSGPTPLALFALTHMYFFFCINHGFNLQKGLALLQPPFSW